MKEDYLIIPSQILTAQLAYFTAASSECPWWSLQLGHDRSSFPVLSGDLHLLSALLTSICHCLFLFHALFSSFFFFFFLNIFFYLLRKSERRPVRSLSRSVSVLLQPVLFISWLYKWPWLCLHIKDVLNPNEFIADLNGNLGLRARHRINLSGLCPREEHWACESCQECAGLIS